MVGSTLAHYKVEEKLGAGGMGEVYRARDTKLERDVALKTLPAELSQDPDRRQRLIHEARSVAALNHPNIVTVYAIEHEGDLHFLTMELVRGRPLQELIPAEGVSPDQLLDVALPLTDAVAAAHELGVVHRDLKPANLMVSDDGRLKVLDFGLATVVAPRPGVRDANLRTATQILPTGSVTGTVAGTIAYMSPEQVEGRPADPRSDIFSLGIILYEMATGSRPFSGDSTAALVSSILKDQPPSVTEIRSDLSSDLGRIVRRCLEKDPKRRFQTCRDVHNELALLRDTPDAIRLDAVPRSAAAGESSQPGTFAHDLYISYAHLDNEAQLTGQDGWVSAFHRSLEVRVGQLLGKKPSIWRDPKTRGDETSDESKIEHLPKSALLITVLSPRYVKSEWCNRELREFLRATRNSGGPKWGSRYRVFKVVKTPTPIERHPQEIQPLLGYEFFKIDPETGRPRELDQIFGPEAQREYWARLDDLAHDVVELLERIEEEPPEISGETSEKPVTGVSLDAAGGKGTIYLAHTTYDLKEAHDAVRRDLQRNGYKILPESPLPLIEHELRSFVREQLAASRMSVHLVGANYGVVPEGATMSVVALQNDLAIERATEGGLSRVVWIPPDLTTVDDRQSDFIDALRTDPRSHAGSDLLETPLEDLKTVLYQLLEPPQRPGVTRVEKEAGDVKRVYLICDQRDQEHTAPLADFLFEVGYEVTLPVFEGDEAEVREDHEDNLRVCDGVLVFYGAANELWLRRKLREMQKSAGLGRTRAIRAKGIWIAPPVTSQKSRLRTRDAVVMQQPDSFAADPLQPFLDALGKAN